MLRLQAPLADAPPTPQLTLVGGYDSAAEAPCQSSSQPQLRHAQNQAELFDSTDLKFNRRSYPRKVLAQELTAVYTDSQGERGITRMGVIDGSWTGLGVITMRDVPLGTNLSFCAPGTPVMTRHGQVVRREVTPTGYRLGIKLDAKRSG